MIRTEKKKSIKFHKFPVKLRAIVVLLFLLMASKESFEETYLVKTRNQFFIYDWCLFFSCDLRLLGCGGNKGTLDE